MSIHGVNARQLQIISILKEAFLRFVKPFSDTDIEKCWEQVLADDTRVIEFDGFSTETSKFNGNIEYMSIYGFIE